MQDVNWTALVIFILLFGFITWLGFVAARWRKGDLELLQEWGLGGKRFGTVVTWFLIGGDLYTAYTFIAMLWVSSYDRVEPMIGGVPFFYWYQLGWVIVGALIIGFIYLVER